MASDGYRRGYVSFAHFLPASPAGWEPAWEEVLVSQKPNALPTELSGNSKDPKMPHNWVSGLDFGPVHNKELFRHLNGYVYMLIEIYMKKPKVHPQN